MLPNLWIVWALAGFAPSHAAWRGPRSVKTFTSDHAQPTEVHPGLYPRFARTYGAVSLRTEADDLYACRNLEENWAAFKRAAPPAWSLGSTFATCRLAEAVALFLAHLPAPGLSATGENDQIRITTDLLLAMMEEALPQRSAARRSFKKALRREIGRSTNKVRRDQGNQNSLLIHNSIVFEGVALGLLRALGGDCEVWLRKGPKRTEVIDPPGPT